MLMPPLIEKWNALKDTDKDLFPLLEVSRIIVVICYLLLVVVSVIEGARGNGSVLW